MGRGFPILALSKQKLNIRISTELEIIGVNQIMPSVIWTSFFFESRGYGVTENIIYQDNTSSILLGNNQILFCNWKDSQSIYISGIVTHR